MSSEIRQDVEMLFPTAVKVVLRILDHHKIKTCLVGEFALNYYNVPDVVHVCQLLRQFHGQSVFTMPT